MTSSFAAYLASLDAPLSVLAAPETASPQKRPRSDSPDSDTVRNDSTSAFFAESSSLTTTIHTSTTTVVTPSSTNSNSTSAGCAVIRSILTHFTSVTPGPHSSSPTSITPASSSPPTSCPLSRRSSTGLSAKSVRFARCTNASVFPALSGEEYDRSPIIPTCESESLELPRRKRSEAEGWIKCVERARADAKKKAEQGKTACAPYQEDKSAVVAASGFGPVEGVNGLIGGRMGGYFVGDEREENEEEFEEEDDDGMVVDDDFEEGNDDDAESTHEPSSTIPQSQLVSTSDDISSGDDSDTVPSSSIRSDSSSPSSPPSSAHPDELCTPKSSTSTITPTLGGLGFERTESVDVEEEMTDEERRAQEEEEERLERRRACKAKYGLCSLGKFTRKEVFQSYDSLGGF